MYKFRGIWAAAACGKNDFWPEHWAGRAGQQAHTNGLPSPPTPCCRDRDPEVGEEGWGCSDGLLTSSLDSFLIPAVAPGGEKEGQAVGRPGG